MMMIMISYDDDQLWWPRLTWHQPVYLLWCSSIQYTSTSKPLVVLTSLMIPRLAFLDILKTLCCVTIKVKMVELERHSSPWESPLSTRRSCGRCWGVGGSRARAQWPCPGRRARTAQLSRKASNQASLQLFFFICFNLAGFLITWY